MPLFCSCDELLVIYEPVQQVECSFISVIVSSPSSEVNKDSIAFIISVTNTKSSVEELDLFTLWLQSVQSMVAHDFICISHTSWSMYIQNTCHSYFSVWCGAFLWLLCGSVPTPFLLFSQRFCLLTESAEPHWGTAGVTLTVYFVWRALWEALF